MDPALKAVLTQPGWENTFARAVLHADTRIRKFIWRGFRLKSMGDNEIAVGDKTAKDFVSDALERLIDGRRTFDAARTLLDNLNSVTDSLIWSEKKSSDRGGIVDYADEHDAEGNPADPISLTADRGPSPDEQLKEAELRQDQDRCFKTIYASFDGDTEMQLYLEALAARIFKRSEISDLTGMNVETIDELRRKLAKDARRFFGATDFEELQRRLHEGT